MMLTDRGKGVLAAAAAFWLASRVFGVPALGMTATAALLLVLLSLLFSRVASTRLTVERDIHPRRLFFDARARVDLRLRNRSRLPTASIEVIDQVPIALSERPGALLPSLAAGGVATLSYEVLGRQRGRHQLGPVTVGLRDPFGLVRRRRTFGVQDEIVVYPPVWRLPEVLPLAGGSSAGGEGRPRPLQHGEDLANVREYVRGDDLRKVHWPTTAHRGRLMVRQPEAPQDPRGVVVLDIRADRHVGHGPGASIETVVAAAASATYLLASHGRAVTVLDRPLQTPPRARPWQGWLEYLADRQADAVDLQALWLQLARGAAGDGVLIAVVTIPTPGELRELVRAGRAFSSRIAVVVDAGSHGRRPQTGDAAVAVNGLRAAGWRAAPVAANDRLDLQWAELANLRRTAG